MTLAAGEFLKGRGPGEKGTITFRQLGGRDGDRIIYVPGSPRFSPKQEVLVFLTGNDSAGYPQVMGIFQGAFRPVTGPGGERRVEGISPSAVTSLLPEKGKGSAQATPESVLGDSFADFLERIRMLVKEQAAGRGR